MNKARTNPLERLAGILRRTVAGKPYERRRIRHKLATRSALLFGDFYISDDYQLWREDKDFLDKYRELDGNPYSQDRKFLLREFARFVKHIPGSMAECGCYQGASAWFIANELPEVPLYLFDSFEGLSDPSDEDKPSSENHMEWQSGDLSSAEGKTRELLREFENIGFYKGWIPERFPEVSSDRFRLVHIDVDLYEPTRDSMEFFYPRMSPGGVIVLDDYGQTSCPGAYKAVNDFMSDKPEHVLLVPTSQGVIIKSHDHTR